jgi:hypothetical protein
MITKYVCKECNTSSYYEYCPEEYICKKCNKATARSTIVGVDGEEKKNWIINDRNSKGLPPLTNEELHKIVYGVDSDKILLDWKKSVNFRRTEKLDENCGNCLNFYRKELQIGCIIAERNFCKLRNKYLNGKDVRNLKYHCCCISDSYICDDYIYKEG